MSWSNSGSDADNLKTKSPAGELISPDGALVLNMNTPTRGRSSTGRSYQLRFLNEQKRLMANSIAMESLFLLFDRSTCKVVDHATLAAQTYCLFLRIYS
jgi:hypothetical protein